MGRVLLSLPAQVPKDALLRPVLLLLHLLLLLKLSSTRPSERNRNELQQTLTPPHPPPTPPHPPHTPPYRPLTPLYLPPTHPKHLPKPPLLPHPPPSPTKSSRSLLSKTSTVSGPLPARLQLTSSASLPWNPKDLKERAIKFG